MRAAILMPARNAAGTIAAALRSVQRQTLRDFECIVVDDGSIDGTASIAGAYAREDARIRVVRTGAAGLVPALDRGLRECGAPIVVRMDADDLMRRDRLVRVVGALEVTPRLIAVGSHVRLTPRAGLTPRRRDYERWLNGMRDAGDVRRERFIECPVAHPTLAVRTDVLRRVGYREVDWPEDYDLVLRLLAAGREIGVVPRRLLAWRDGPRRLTRTHGSYGQERIVACKAHHLAAGFLATTDRYVLWGYGGTGRALRRALALHGRHPSHVVELHAGRLGNRIHGAPVVPPEALDDLPRGGLVASVAGAAARGEIRAFLAARGWIETRDFVCAA